MGGLIREETHHIEEHEPENPIPEIAPIIETPIEESAETTENIADAVNDGIDRLIERENVEWQTEQRLQLTQMNQTLSEMREILMNQSRSHSPIQESTEPLNPEPAELILPPAIDPETDASASESEAEETPQNLPSKISRKLHVGLRRRR